MTMLEGLTSVVVRQEVERLELVSGLETANRYQILDGAGNELLRADEESSFAGRQFLGGHRPLTFRIADREGKEVLRAKRGFVLLFSHLELYTPEAGLIGRMDRRFAFFNRKFDFADGQGIPLGAVEGPLWRPYTFWVRRSGLDLAKITKEWSGVLREAFTRADTFAIDFLDPSMDERLRLITLGAALAIDIDYFERRSRGRGGGSIGFGGHTGGITGRGI